MSKGLPHNILQLGFALKLDASSAEAKWQKVFPLGETRHRSDFGSITFDRAFLSQMLENYASEGKPERPWDYFHRGSSDDTALPNSEKVASGWFSDMKLEADGLYVLTRWTERARAAIAAEELRYPSPTFITNATDPKTGAACGPKLLAVALLNDPFLTDLPAVEASAHPKGPPMKLALATIVAAAKLADTVTEDNLEAELKAKAAKLEAAEAELVTLKADAGKKDGAAGELVKKLSDQVADLASKLKKQDEASAAAAIAALQVKLESEGRIKADQKEMVAKLCASVGLAEATSMTAGWPVVIDLKERGSNKPGPANGMTPEEAHKQLEMKAAELAKANPADAPQAYFLAAKANPALALAAQQVKPADRRS